MPCPRKSESKGFTEMSQSKETKKKKTEKNRKGKERREGKGERERNGWEVNGKEDIEKKRLSPRVNSLKKIIIARLI
jgi:hypothetical protein